MIKVSKVNIVAVCVGKDRHCDWYLDLGDYLTTTSQSIYDHDEASWLFPMLHTTSSPATTITNYVKALRVGSSIQKYQDVAVEGLPHNATAGVCIRIVC